MTRQEARNEAIKAFDRASQQRYAAYEQLRSQGWNPRGLDGEVPPEIKAIDDECRRKIQELAAQIED